MLCLFVCILALFIQYAKRIRHIILPLVTWQVAPHYITNGTIFGKNRMTDYILILSTSWSETLQVHLPAHCHKCTENFMKRSVILWVFNSSWIFYIDFRKMLQNRKWWMAKHLESVRSLRTERHEETSIRFYQFCIRSYKVHTQNFIHNIHKRILEILAVHQTRKNFLSC